VLAIFKLIPVTLTLAGIGGFVLSIGMAIDANILIFERMKEELQMGRTLGAATESGFRRAWVCHQGFQHHHHAGLRYSVLGGLKHGRGGTGKGLFLNPVYRYMCQHVYGNNGIPFTAEGVCRYKACQENPSIHSLHRREIEGKQ